MKQFKTYPGLIISSDIESFYVVAGPCKRGDILMLEVNRPDFSHIPLEFSLEELYRFYTPDYIAIAATQFKVDLQELLK